MAGYTRQSVADIIANAVIKAAPVNAEFNAIRDAFNSSTGHKHDGTSAEGAYVPLIADLDGKNKVVIDTTNNRIGVFVEVGGTAVEQLRIQDGAIVPVTDNDIDLGSSSLEFKDLYIDGIGYIDDVIVTGTATLANVDINAGAIDNTVIGNTTAVAGTFTNMTATGTSTITTADINGGNIDGTIIGSTTAAAGTFTNLTSTGTSTHTTVDINGGNIDGTVIGASSAAAGSFTTVSTSGQATLATVNIDGGTIDGTTIGATTATTGAFTTVSASGGFTGDLTGAVTGNVTGNVTGAVTGDLTGNVTGNVTASSGSSTFNNMTINGTLDVTSTTINNVSDPTTAQQAATKNYVDTQVANLVDSAPGTLDTLNELAAALGDDPNFSTTITTSIATKLPLAGGTMSGAIAMGTSKITGLGDPTAAQDAATKTYVDTQRDTRLPLSGGTMSGAINMGSNLITNVTDPSSAQDAATKNYIDTLFGSTTDAAASAAAAATSESNAATSETNASNSATAAASSATDAAASYDSFDDRYLGAKASGPTLDNDGDALITGALYFDTTANLMKVYDGSSWVDAGSAVNGTSERQTYTATAAQTIFAVTYDVGFVDVWLNGVKLVAGTDYTATSGTSIVLTTGAALGDIVDIIAFGAFSVANTYTQTAADAKFLQVSNNLSDLADAATARTNLGVITTLLEDTTPQLGGDLDLNSSDITGTGNISITGSVGFANWTITESGGSLYFATGGTNKMKLDATGNLDVVGNVNTNATIT
jgi:hypothetical protein